MKKSKFQLSADDKLIAEFFREHERQHPFRSSDRRPSRARLWATKGPARQSISLSFVGHFDARGMRAIYGRGDYFGRRCLRMDVWRSTTGRILARFWSRSSEVDSESHEVRGLEISTRSLCPALADNEHLVPECLRDAYDKWVVSEMPLIY
jgi:hypothetical protein